jgi:hypothetical protein
VSHSPVIDHVVKTFSYWLHMPDPGALYAVLGTVAANRMSGDPVWTVWSARQAAGRRRSSAASPDWMRCIRGDVDRGVAAQRYAET